MAKLRTAAVLSVMAGLAASAAGQDGLIKISLHHASHATARDEPCLRATPIETEADSIAPDPLSPSQVPSAHCLTSARFARTHLRCHDNRRELTCDLITPPSPLHTTHLQPFLFAALLL